MRTRYLLLALVFFLVLAMPVHALELNGYSFELVRDASDYPKKVLDRIVEPRYYTPQCLVECDLTYTMKKNTAGNLQLERSDLSWYFQEWQKENGFEDIRVKYLANETFYHQEPIEECETGTRLDGTTGKICHTNGYNEIEDWRLVWKKVPASIPVKSGQLYAINIRAISKASLNEWSVDLVPMLKNMYLTEFAWWNSSFGKYANISSNQAPNRNESITFFMNDIVGWSRGDIENDCSDIRIVNESSNEELDYYVDVCNNTHIRVGFLNKYNVSGVIASVYWNATVEAENKSMRMFFDDFNDNSIDTNDWAFSTSCTNTGNVAEQNEVLNQTGTVGGSCDFFWYSNTSALRYETVYAKWYSYLEGGVNQKASGISLNIRNISGQNARNLMRGGNDPDTVVFLDQAVAWGTPQAFPLSLDKWFWFMTYADAGNYYGKVWNVTDQNEPVANTVTQNWASRDGWFGLYFDANNRVTFDDFQVWAVGYRPTFYITSSTLTLGGTQNLTAGTWINYTNDNDNVPAKYNPSFSSDFETEWTSTDSNGYNVSLFHSNHTGSWVAYPTSRTGNYSYTNITVGATTFQWYMWANNSIGNANFTANHTNTIALNDSTSCFQTFAESTPITYPTGLTARCSCEQLEGTTRMYQNATNVTAANNSATVYGASAYNYVCNVTASGNYTTETATDNFTINRGTPTFISTIGGIVDTNASFFPENSNVTINHTIVTGTGECIKATCFNTFWLNDTLGDWDTAGQPIWHTTNPNNFQYFGWNNTLAVDDWYFMSNNTETANYSASETIWHFSIGTILSVDVLDEQTETGINFNITLSNDSFSSTAYNQTLFQANSTNMPYGDIQIIIWAAGYGQRNYYVDGLSNASNETIIGYLVSGGTQVSFTIRNILEQPLDDIEIDIVRVLSDGWTVVAQGITDDTGAYPFYLDTNANYKINLYDPDAVYDTKNSTLIPSATTYTIYMFREIYEIPSYWMYWREIDTSCAFTNASRQVECNWTDTSTHLDNITMTVTEMNLTYTNDVCVNHSASSSGTFQCTVPAPNNMTYQWSLVGELSSEATEITFHTGSYSDILQIALGLTGVFAAALIILLSGSIGVQMGSPSMTVLGTMIGVGVALIWGFLTVPAGVVIMMMGLFVAGGILIFKMR